MASVVLANPVVKIMIEMADGKYYEFTVDHIKRAEYIFLQGDSGAIELELNMVAVADHGVTGWRGEDEKEEPKMINEAVAAKGCVDCEKGG